MIFGKYNRLKKNMIEMQLIARGIKSEQVLAAFNSIERHNFVDDGFEQKAYDDSALPISSGQTISQPFMVAYMSEKLELNGSEKILEIGTGSGFQAAILKHIGCQVFTIERHQNLFLSSKKRFETLGLNIEQRLGDGTLGWADKAPFDRIILTAGAPNISLKLCEQLAENGFMLIPVGAGKDKQILTKITKQTNQFIKEELVECAFVPLIGEEGWKS
jgi:protein-L-isoaspartate(D-aspartate) O-methyltransferase